MKAKEVSEIIEMNKRNIINYYGTIDKIPCEKCKRKGKNIYLFLFDDKTYKLCKNCFDKKFKNHQLG